MNLDRLWDAEWEQHVMRIALERVKAKVSVKQFQMFDLHALQGLSVRRRRGRSGERRVGLHGQEPGAAAVESGGGETGDRG